MIRRLRAIILACFGLWASISALQAQSLDKNPYAGDEEAIAEGETLYVDTGCYACHGRKAEGAVGPSLVDDEWVRRPTDKTLFAVIANGRRGTNMVGWKDHLTEDQIWRVLAWIRSIYQGDPDKVIW